MKKGPSRDRHVAMIPARGGSKRLPRKNLRYLGSKPLLAWVTEMALKSGFFDEVYVNTEDDAIASLAEELGAKVYRRDRSLASDWTTSEHFVRDFVERVECDVAWQLLPTSPFLSLKDVQRAERLLIESETVLSVKAIQAECFDMRRKPVNFFAGRPLISSQRLDPVYVMCNGVVAWRVSSFKARYARSGAAVLGGGHRTQLLVLEGDAAIDIDREEDFAAAEAVLRARREPTVPLYWAPGTRCEADDDTGVLVRDGVADSTLERLEEESVVSLPSVLASLPDAASYAFRVVDLPGASATVISQMPGEGNRWHCHPDADEWWHVLEGQYELFEEDGSRILNKGDLVSMPRGRRHMLRVVGDGRAVRLAMNRPGAAHVYESIAGQIRLLDLVESGHEPLG